MNLRQKAKYYKKHCEMLEKLTLPNRHPFDYTDTEQPIVTLRSEQFLPFEEYVAMQAAGDMGLTMINNIITRGFMPQLLDYAHVIVQRDEISGRVVIKAAIKVVDTRKELDEVQ